MQRIRNNMPGPGQSLVVLAIRLASTIWQRVSAVRWVPGRGDVEGDDQVDQYMAEAAP